VDDIEYTSQEHPDDAEHTEYTGREWYPDLVLSAYAITRDWGRAEQVVREVLARTLGRGTETPPERLLAETIRLARVRTFAGRLRRRKQDPYLPDAVRAHEIVVAQHLAGRTDAEIAAATDTREEDVAAALAAVRAATPPPEHIHLRNRLRQQRVRRKTLVGAAVAVLVVGVAVPLLRESEPKPASQLVLPPPTPPRERHIFWVDFVDREHGYALRLDCAQTPRSASSCVTDVLVTDDGDHWTARTVPRPERDGVQLTGFPRVLGPRELVVDWQADPTSGFVDRMHSTDGGRHWARVDVPATITRTTPAIPDGGSLMLTCARATLSGSCETPALGVVLPGSGETALLATQPVLTDIMFDPTWMVAGDRWWAAGHDPTTGKWALAVTADAGRSWWTTPVDVLGEAINGSWSVGGSGQTLYAAIKFQSTPDDAALAALYRSDDGGRSWIKAWQREGQPPVLGFFGTPIVKPDGTVQLHGFDLTSSSDRPTTITYVSDDHGATFTKATSEERIGYVYWTRAGYLSTPLAEGDPYQLSTDGTSWERVDLD